MNIISQNMHQYSTRELVNLRDQLAFFVNRHHNITHNIANAQLFTNDMFPPQQFNMGGLNLMNQINNRDVGFEMVTTVSANSPIDLPDSLLNVIQNLIGDVAIETLDSQGGVNNAWLSEPVRVALPKECIRMMPSKRFKGEQTTENDGDNNDEPECTICFDKFVKNERYRELPCKHMFHKRCVDRWFDKSVNCPMCRQDIRDMLARSQQDENPNGSSNHRH
jgi:hypothetical protein